MSDTAVRLLKVSTDSLVQRSCYVGCGAKISVQVHKKDCHLINSVKVKDIRVQEKKF